MALIKIDLAENMLSQRYTIAFLLDCLRFSKLLKLHQTEGRISSNLIKRKQSSRKTSIVCRWLYE